MISARGDAVHALLRLTRPLVLNSERIVARQLRQSGWTVGMRAVAEVLDGIGPATVPQIASELDLPRQAVQRLTDDLRTLGHVVTTPNPAHRRSVLVRLTAEGASVFGAVRDRERRRLEQLLPGVSEEDLATATAVLAALDDDIRTLAREATDDR
ncbi:MarR family winged helix-turn-helix transcriptional regulator [Brachybacterium hainanense]|uniref:MarR family winged helix-turn-helix transcriptional regulator n=1 Tax=Brachybacterium hainanense TaxID=1541174 RepID=A0ABV6RB83_9MICO